MCTEFWRLVVKLEMQMSRLHVVTMQKKKQQNHADWSLYIQLLHIHINFYTFDHQFAKLCIGKYFWCALNTVIVKTFSHTVCLAIYFINWDWMLLQSMYPCM